MSNFPINRFPREVLAEIFWNCLPETDMKGPVQMSKKDAPLLVSSICSSWRELALATPKLWTTVGIILEADQDTDPSATAIQVVNTWLERSRTLPLKLHLAELSDEPDDDDSAMSITNPTLSQSILFAFYPHSSRWQDVSLSLYGIQSLMLPRLDAPILRSFHLSGPSQETSHFPFRNSSRLTELSWPSSIDVSMNPHIPWSQVSYLKLSNGMSLFSVSETIRLCSQLEEFWVGCSALGGVANLPRKPTKVKNGRLRTLELHFNGDIGPLLHSLTLPALEQLVCYAENDEASMVPIPDLRFESLRDFLTRSGCKLKKLMLGECNFTADELLACLEHEASETIQDLTIEGLPKLTDDVLLRLAHPPYPTAARILLPKLTHLTLKHCLHASPGTLGDMVYSRYHPETGEVAKLEFFALSVHDLNSEDLTIIEDLTADGLGTNISIMSRDFRVEIEFFPPLPVLPNNLH